MQDDFLAGVRLRVDAHDHLAGVGELDGIVDQIGDDLAQPSGIANQSHRHIGRDPQRQFQSFGVGFEGQSLQHLFEGGA